ncbi:hypothetical protein FHG87_002744 [Trinorchestia longiramus]|nr:hypothetical protein FHG87_002744 [Trinorchestia longiramus]
MVYNFTALSQPNNLVGVSLVIPLQVAALGVIVGFSLGKRRRRRNTRDKTTQLDLTHKLMLQLIHDLDDQGCAAGALCEAVTVPRDQRTAPQILLLDALSSSVGAVPSFKSLLQMPQGKFVYAAFIGVQNTGQPQVCKMAFPECPVTFSAVTEQLAQNTRPCRSPANQLPIRLTMEKLVTQNLSSNNTEVDEMEESSVTGSEKHSYDLQ